MSQFNIPEFLEMYYGDSIHRADYQNAVKLILALEVASMNKPTRVEIQPKVIQPKVTPSKPNPKDTSRFRGPRRLHNMRSRAKIERAAAAGNTTALVFKALEDATKPLNSLEIGQVARLNPKTVVSSIARLLKFGKPIRKVYSVGHYGYYALAGSRAMAAILPGSKGLSRPVNRPNDGRLHPDRTRRARVIEILDKAGKAGLLTAEVAAYAGAPKMVAAIRMTLRRMFDVGKVTKTLEYKGKERRARWRLPKHTGAENEGTNSQSNRSVVSP